MEESLWLTSIARSTGRGRGLIAGEELVWRALISGRVLSHLINLSAKKSMPSAGRRHNMAPLARASEAFEWDPLSLCRMSLHGKEPFAICRPGSIRQTSLLPCANTLPSVGRAADGIQPLC